MSRYVLLFPLAPENNRINILSRLALFHTRFALPACLQ